MPLQRLPILMADTSLPRPRVVRVLEQIRRYSGVPVTIFVNSDPEFAGRALAAWTHDRGVASTSPNPGSRSRARSARASTASSGTSS